MSHEKYFCTPLSTAVVTHRQRPVGPSAVRLSTVKQQEGKGEEGRSVVEIIIVVRRTK